MAIEDRLTDFLRDAHDWETRATNIPSISIEITFIHDKAGSLRRRRDWYEEYDTF